MNKKLTEFEEKYGGPIPLPSKNIFNVISEVIETAQLNTDDVDDATWSQREALKDVYVELGKIDRPLLSKLRELFNQKKISKTEEVILANTFLTAAIIGPDLSAVKDALMEDRFDNSEEEGSLKDISEEMLDPKITSFLENVRSRLNEIL